jgi:hypothetical protein
MTNVLPGAVWQPVDVSGRAARRKGRGLVGHVAVSSSKNLVPGPLATRSADWHFYLPKAGAAIQYIDMDLQCWASSAGNASLVAFESEGGLGTSAQLNAEPWTENQCQWAARILRHLHDTEGVPLQAMPDSLPTSRGFGTHRLGISPWRVAGGEVWSSANGKECPGNAKVAQVPHIIELAVRLTSRRSPTRSPSSRRPDRHFTGERRTAMPQNARRRFPGDTGGPWGTGLLGTGLAIATIGVGYILTEPERLPPPLAWINQFIPIAGWGLLFVGAGLFSVIRAFSPPQRPVDVAPAVTVVSLWSAFFIVFWLYEGLWLGTGPATGSEAWCTAPSPPCSSASRGR